MPAANIGATGLSLGVDLTHGRADSGDPEIDLLELVEDVAVALGEEGRAFGSFIDEMQDLDVTTVGPLLAAQHLAGQRQWPFYVIGAGLPNLPAAAPRSARTRSDSARRSRPTRCHCSCTRVDLLVGGSILVTLRGPEGVAG